MTPEQRALSEALGGSGSAHVPSHHSPGQDLLTNAKIVCQAVVMSTCHPAMIVGFGRVTAGWHMTSPVMLSTDCLPTLRGGQDGPMKPCGDIIRPRRMMGHKAR